jgi:hypothetical protein
MEKAVNQPFQTQAANVIKVKNLVFNQLIKGLPTAGGGQHIVNAPKSLKVPPPGRISETARDPDHQRPMGSVEGTQRPPLHTTVQRKAGFTVWIRR